MPGKKSVFRLYSNDGHALIDLLQLPDEPPPEVNKRVLCRHPFQVQILKTRPTAVVINSWAHSNQGTISGFSKMKLCRTHVLQYWLLKYKQNLLTSLWCKLYKDCLCPKSKETKLPPYRLPIELLPNMFRRTKLFCSCPLAYLVKIICFIQAQSVHYRQFQSFVMCTLEHLTVSCSCARFIL